MKNQHEIIMNYTKAWRCKERALELARVYPASSYEMMLRYLYMLRKSNPGSVVKFKLTQEVRFKYVYMAIYGSIKG